MTDLEWGALKRMGEAGFKWGGMHFQYLRYSNGVVLTHQQYKRIPKEKIFYSDSEIDKDIRSRLKILYDKYYSIHYTQ